MVSNKADSINPSLTFYHVSSGEAPYTQFRLAGSSGSQGLACVYTDTDGNNTYNTIVDYDGTFIAKKADKSHASSTASTYGAGTASYYGHVKLSDNYTSSAGAASASVGASSLAVYNCYSNRAPISHASSATTYGIGTASNYGHVKLSDSYVISSGSASSGVAASSSALYNAYRNCARRGGFTMTSAYNCLVLDVTTDAGLMFVLYYSGNGLVVFRLNLENLYNDNVTTLTDGSSYISCDHLITHSKITQYTCRYYSDETTYNTHVYRIKLIFSSAEGACGVVFLSTIYNYSYQLWTQ